MRRWRPLALALALLLAGCGQEAALDRLAPAGRGRVAEARAGDVVVLEGGERVKLAGLAALSPRSPYGPEARAALERLTLGKAVELLTGGAAEDPFGRRVAHLRLAGDRRWVQGEMLAAGAARVRTFPDNRALAAEMLELEAQARIARRGLWALDAYRVKLPAEARAARGFQIVEGRVEAVRRRGRGFSLRMRGMTAEIPAYAVADFETAGKAPPDLAGRLVRIRGSMRRGPSIRLDHPEALELLND